MAQAMGGDFIAVRALGITPQLTRGFDRQLGAQLSGGAIASQADGAGKSLGSRLGSSITSTLKTTLKVGGVVAGALAGITLKGGSDRALGIESARAKLTGLGNDTKSVEKIMGNALASVEGTAFGLDEAATTAAGAVAAGIKPGEQLESTLKTVANTAAAAGTGMDEIGNVFNTVSAVGSAYTGDINMIAQRGIPIWQSLGTTLGKSQEEVKKMATEGKIDFATFEAAAKDASGGVAAAMGDTTKGSFDNMMASVRKLGAMFVTGILPLAKTTFQGIQGLLNAVKAKLEPFVEGFFGRFGSGAEAGIQSFFDGLIGRIEAFDPTPVMNFFKEVEGGIKAFGASWQAFDGDVTSAGFPGFMERAAFTVRTVWEEASGGIKAFVAAWKYNDGEVTSSGFPGFMERAGYMVRQLWDAMKGLDFSSFSNFTASLGAVDLSGAGTAIQGVATGLGAMGQAAPGVLSIAIQGVGNAMKFLSDHADTVVKLLPWLIAGFVAYRGASQAVTAAATYQRSAYIATLPVRLASNSALAIANGLELANSILTRKNTTEKNVNAAATTRQTVAEKLSTAAKKTGAIATRVLGAAMRFALGPIGLIITGITLLATGLYLFFTKTETGKEIWAKVWGAIKNAVAAVVDWFMTTALPFLQSAWDGIAAGALWLYNNAILPAWNGIRAAIGAVADWVVGTLVPWFQSAWTAIATAAQWLYNNVIMPVWTGIRIAIAIAVTAIMVYIDLMKWYFKNVIAPVALWLYNSIIKPVWNGIKSAIGAVVTWMAGTAWPILKAAWDAIAAAARWLYGSVILPVWNAIKAAIAAVINWIKNVGWPALKLTIDWIASAFRWVYNSVILPVWNGIKAAIKAVVDWFQNTAWPLVKRIIDFYATGFRNLYNLVIKPVWAAIKAAIKAVVDWFQNTAWPLVKKILGLLKNGFNAMRDAIKAAWDYVKDKAIRPVIDWFTNTAKPKIDDFTTKVKNGFTKLKDGVLAAWDKIKEGMKKPINGVIGIYNTHIKDNFNKVADTLKLDDKYRLPNMATFHTGGYTGPGAKYQEAGIVHADEYVIRKESQNDIARRAPGFLDSLNKHGSKALGYASGGLVKLRSPFGTSAPRGEGFGARGGRHKGIDYPMPSGTVLKAVAAGVASRTSNAAAGNKLELSIGNGLVAGYHHLSSFIAGNGASVGRGADVGRVGSTGRSSGPHLHFSLKKNGTYVDPAPYLGAGGDAGSGDDNSWWNPFTGLWNTIKEKVSSAVGEGPIAGIVSQVAENTIGGVGDWVTSKIAAIGDFVSEGVDTAGGVARWTPVATEALAREGQLGPKRFASLMARMKQESNFDPKAINNWDSNAKAGNSSRGLMQVIPSTFNAYRDKSLSSDIYDPLANIVASIRYTLSRYGDLEKGWNRKGGYAAGGWTGPGAKYQPAGTVHADEFVVQKSSRRSIESARPGFLDALNRRGAAALTGYANGGLVGYAAGGKVSPTAKIGSAKVTVLLDGLMGTEKQVKSAAGKLADGIVKTFNDKLKSAKTATVNRLSDSLAGLKKQASSLNKTISATTAKSKKNTINKLTDDLAGLRKQAKSLTAASKATQKVTTVVGKSKKTSTVATAAAKKAATQLKSVNKQIASTQSALTQARRGNYSGAAAKAQSQLKSVQKQIASTEKALKAARRGETGTAATKAADAFFTKYAASATAKLQALGKQSDTLTKKLKNAKTALTESIKVRDEYAGSLTEKFAGAYGITGDSATTGIETIIRGFKNAATTVTTFSRQLATLKKRGLSDGLIDQVAQLGSEEGSKVAKNLLTASNSQLKSITSQYNALNKASASTGTALGKQMYQSGVNGAQGLVNGLSSQLNAVTKASEKLANAVINTVTKKLKIHSPSRVFKEIGEFTGDGMVLGIEARVPAARAAAGSLVDPDGLLSQANRTSRPDVSFGVSSASRPASATGGVVARNGGPLIGHAVVNGLDADEVASKFDKIIRKREALYS